MENYFEIDEPKKTKGFTIGKLFKWIAIIIVVLIYAILIVRCTIFQGDVDIVSKILTNDITISSYNADPDVFVVEEYGMNSPWVAVAEGRLIQFYHLNHIKAAKQLQFAIKYNTDIATDMNADGIPFKFRLIDNYNNTYDDYFFEQKSRFNYNYIRICFDGIELIDELAEPDENGIIPRKKYTLYIDKLMPDGTYFEYTKYDLYTGLRSSDPVNFKISTK